VHHIVETRKPQALGSGAFFVGAMKPIVQGARLMSKSTSPPQPSYFAGGFDACNRVKILSEERST